MTATAQSATAQSASRRQVRALGHGLVSAGFIAGAVVAGELLSLLYGKGWVRVPFLLEAVVEGLVASLFAAGLLLIYKSSRIINFAHGAISTGTAMLALTMVGERWSWWVAVPISLAAAIGAAVLIEVSLMRRFATAARLVPTVATIAAGQLLVAMAYVLPIWRFSVNLFKTVGPEDLARLPNRQLHAPFVNSVTWRTSVVLFTGDHLLAVVASVTALFALGAFLRYSKAGTAIRAAAENRERAELLGVSTGSLGTIVWAIAGGLAGLGVVLTEPLHHTTLIGAATAGSSASALLAGLAAAILARMTDLPRAVAAAIALTIFQQCVFVATGRTALNDLALLIVIGAALLLQRKRLSRIAEAVSSGWAATDEIRPVPPVLRALPAVQTARRWVATVLFVTIAGVPFVLSPSQTVRATTFAIFGIVAVSLVILAGWGGQISLGQFGLVAVGASVGGSLTANAHFPFPVAALLGSLAGAAVATLLGLPALRIRGLYLAVTTLAFAVAMYGFVLDRNRFGFLVPATVNRPRLAFINFGDERVYYYLVIACLAASVMVALSLRRTRTGRVLIAMRDNEYAAQSFGISLMRTRLVTFAISGFLAAFAGVLLVHQTRALHPETFLPEMSVQMFLMAVIGGLGSVSGVLTGAIYLGAANVFVSDPAIQLLISGGGLLVVLVFYPSGLGGALYAVRDGWLKRIALREKIYVRSLLGDARGLTSERSRAPLARKPAPEPRYEIESEVRQAGASQRGKGWVYQ